MAYVKNFFTFVLLSLACFFLRGVGLHRPLTDCQYWRQTDTASIARNFFREDYNIFHPRVDWRGSGEGLVESEFPLYPFMVATLYKIGGGVEEAYGRFLSILFGILTTFILYLFTLRLFDFRTALFAGLMYIISPLSVFYNRTFMQDSMVLFLYLFSLFLFHYWAYQGGKRVFVLGLFVSALAVLAKPTSVFLFIPVAGILYDTRRLRFLWDMRFYVFLFLVLAPSGLWYYYAHTLYKISGLTFGIVSGGYDKFNILQTLFSGEYWTALFSRFFGSIFTPAGGTLLILGTAAAFSNREVFGKNRFLFAWLLSLVLYTLIIAEGNQRLDYYQLFYLPVGAIVIARTAFYICERISSRFEGMFLLLSTLLASMAFVSIILIAGTYAKGGNDYTNRSCRFAGPAAKLTPASSRFIVIDTEGSYDRSWYDRMKPRIHRPSLLYYLDRKGWEFLPHEFEQLGSPDLLKLIHEGADYIALPRATLESYAGIADLLKNEKVLFEQEGLVLIELQKGKR